MHNPFPKSQPQNQTPAERINYLRTTESPGDAINYAREWLENNAAQPDVVIALAKAYRDDRQLEKARETLDKAVSLWSKNQDVIAARDHFIAKSERPTTLEAGAAEMAPALQFKIASKKRELEHLLERKQYGTLIEKGDAFLLQHGDNAQILKLLAQASVFSGNTFLLGQYAERGLALLPDNAMLRNFLVISHVAEGKFEEAVAQLQQNTNQIFKNPKKDFRHYGLGLFKALAEKGIGTESYRDLFARLKDALPQAQKSKLERDFSISGAIAEEVVPMLSSKESQDLALSLRPHLGLSSNHAASSRA